MSNFKSAKNNCKKVEVIVRNGGVLCDYWRRI